LLAVLFRPEIRVYDIAVIGGPIGDDLRAIGGEHQPQVDRLCREPSRRSLLLWFECATCAGSNQGAGTVAVQMSRADFGFGYARRTLLLVLNIAMVAYALTLLFLIVGGYDP
jgi:hypothetical protein